MSEQKFQANYPEGSYRLVITDNTIAEAKTGTKSILLNCKVKEAVGKTGNGTTIIFGGKRKVYLYCTSKNIENVKSFLKAAGYEGNPSRLSHLHPDHFSLAGFEFNASCKHNTSEDGSKTFDNFSAYPIKEGSGKDWKENIKVPNEIEMMNLENLFGSAVVPVAVETNLAPPVDLSNPWD